MLMAWIRSIGELGATIMMSYNPHTISIQIFEDNAIGGLGNSCGWDSLAYYTFYNCSNCVPVHKEVP